MYLTYFMALTTLSVAFSVLVLKVHYMSPNYAVPGWVRHIVLGHIAHVLYVKPTDSVERTPCQLTGVVCRGATGTHRVMSTPGE